MNLIYINTATINGVAFWSDDITVSWVIHNNLNIGDYIQLSVNISTGYTWVDRWVNGTRKWNVPLS